MMMFDWVRARKACSIAAMFLTLRELIESDIQAIQEGQDRYKFGLNTLEANKFIVTKSWDIGGIQSSEAVVFELLPRRGIHVKDARAGRQLFLAVPQLEPDGQCRFRIEGDGNGPSLEAWQVSRRALETFFFD